tara:strand:- start:44 stop:316 length:273 start_codon:yes stop_codon:yes gene_type:complete
MSILHLFEILSDMQAETDIKKLRAMRTAIDEKAYDDLYHIKLDTDICGTEGFEQEYAFNNALWALSAALDERIRYRESLWVGVGGLATID